MKDQTRKNEGQTSKLTATIQILKSKLKQKERQLQDMIENGCQDGQTTAISEDQKTGITQASSAQASDSIR